MMQTLPILDPADVLSAQADSVLDERFQALQDRLQHYLAEGAVVAFSGGVDSAFLLWAAEQVRRRHGGRLVALTTHSASMPARDREDARQFAAGLGVEHLWRESHEIEQPEYYQNDHERCYHCKTELFRIAGAVSEVRGYRHLLYGYNASDRGDVRPGHRAALEHEVAAPLAEAELTKPDIRALMRRHGLNLADKPASPCLSSRIMTGIEVTPARLADVEALETLLRAGGLRIFRVRLCREASREVPRPFLRLEVPPEEMPRVLELRDAFVAEGKRRGYHWVTLDLEGYRMGGGVG